MSNSLFHIATIGRPHGVRGLVKIHIMTEEPHLIEDAKILYDEQGRSYQIKLHGAGIAEIRVENEAVISSREDAVLLVNQKLYARNAIRQKEKDEFYMDELIGLVGIDDSSHEIGKVIKVHDYGAGSSLEFESGIIIPFTHLCVPKIDLEGRQVHVVLPKELDGEDYLKKVSS